jgi:hypothetical protein
MLIDLPSIDLDRRGMRRGRQQQRAATSRCGRLHGIPCRVMPDAQVRTAPPIPVTQPPSGGSARRFVYLLVAVALLSALPWLPPIRDWLSISTIVLPAFGIVEVAAHGTRWLLIWPLIGFAIELVMIALEVRDPLLRRAFPLRTAAARELVERQSRRMRFVRNFGFTLAALGSPVLIEVSLSEAVLSRRAALMKEAMEPLATALLRASQDHVLPKLDLNELVPARIDRIPELSASFARPARALLGRSRDSPDARRECVGFSVAIGRRRGFTREGGAWLVFQLGRSNETVIDEAEFATWTPLGEWWREWTDLGDEAAGEARGSWSLVEQG